MSLEQLYTLLTSTGYSVAYQSFKESNVPAMPFLCYAEVGSNNFAADGKVYCPVKRVEVQLFTATKDIEAETKVETALSNLFWDKEPEYIEEELCYRTIYTIEI